MNESESIHQVVREHYGKVAREGTVFEGSHERSD